MDGMLQICIMTFPNSRIQLELHRLAATLKKLRIKITITSKNTFTSPFTNGSLWHIHPFQGLKYNASEKSLAGGKLQKKHTAGGKPI